MGRGDEPRDLSETIRGVDTRSALYALRIVQEAPKRTGAELGLSERVLQFLARKGLLLNHNGRGYTLSELGRQWMNAHGGPFNRGTEWHRRQRSEMAGVYRPDISGMGDTRRSMRPGNAPGQGGS